MNMKIVAILLALLVPVVSAGCITAEAAPPVAVDTKAKLEEYVAKLDGDERRVTVSEYGHALLDAVNATSEAEMLRAAVKVSARENCLDSTFGIHTSDHLDNIQAIITSTPDGHRRYGRYLRISSSVPAWNGKSCDF